MNTEMRDCTETQTDYGSEALFASEAQDQRAEEFERRMRDRQNAQFQRLKDEARALFGMIEGRPGVTSLAKLQELLEKAGDQISNGRFIMRFLGAERYLDSGTVAALITLRQNLIAEIEKPTAADIMMIDAAVIAYYNFLRVQGWIGNLCLVFECEMFGQAPLNEIHGPDVGGKMRDELERLSEIILPLQDRCHRMLIRSLEHVLPHKLPGRGEKRIPAGEPSRVD